MPRIPLEDSFADVISKTQRGYKLTDAALVEKAQITASDLAALKAGEIIVVDVEGVDADAKFTFKGAPKVLMPDSPEDLAEAPTS